MGEGDETVTVRIKGEVERKIAQRGKEHFSKVKSSKERKDKMHKVVNENETKGATMKWELNRGECDEEEAHQFLKSLKRPDRLTPDEEDCVYVSK